MKSHQNSCSNWAATFQGHPSGISLRHSGQGGKWTHEEGGRDPGTQGAQDKPRAQGMQEGSAERLRTLSLVSLVARLLSILISRRDRCRRRLIVDQVWHVVVVGGFRRVRLPHGTNLTPGWVTISASVHRDVTSCCEGATCPQRTGNMGLPFTA